MKKLNPKKVFIIADGSYREITPAEHKFRKETDAGYREKKFIGLHSMIMEVSERNTLNSTATNGGRNISTSSAGITAMFRMTP